MCIIKASIHRASKAYICDNCRGEIRKDDRYMRIFGMAHWGEPPYEVFAHLLCLIDCSRSKSNKPIFDALDKNGPPYKTNEQGNIIEMKYYPGY